MTEYEKLIQRLKEIKRSGYIKTHRTGDTGIGKTLEDLLGIEENNIPGPNVAMLELKSARKSSTSMLTLLTKAPLPRGTNRLLRERFGYPSSRFPTQRELHTTVSALKFNKLKGKRTFKLTVRQDGVLLVAASGGTVGYWDRETLRAAFTKKYPRTMLYVKAQTKGSGANEEFHFNEAWILGGFGFDSFADLLRAGKIHVDIRLGHYPNGKRHDHGTAFRVSPSNQELCFQQRERIM